MLPRGARNKAAEAIVDQAHEWSRREVWIRKLLYPAHTLPTAAAPIMVAVGLAVRDGVFAPVPALLAFLGGWLIQLGGVLTDNYQNLLEEPEDREHPELVRAVKHGTLRLSTLKRAIWACYLLAALASAYLVSVAGIGVAVIGLASIAASWAYSAGPFPVGKAGFADPLFFLFFGVVSVLGGYYVQAAPAYDPALWRIAPEALPWVAIAVGLPVGALTTNILIIDDIRDRKFDALKGKRTVAVRFGKQWSRAEFMALSAFSYLTPVWFWRSFDLTAWVLLPLATLPFAFLTARTVLTRESYQDLLPVTPQAGRLLVAFSVLLAVGIAVS
jgi:1,4-dihydroxy-2-naphthoate octaprenyltransferase